MSGRRLPALVVVDVQRYYLDPDAPFRRYSERLRPGGTGYIANRVRQQVIPALGRLLPLFRSRSWPVVYLRLCGSKEDRSDLHRYFKRFYDAALAEGYQDTYPLCDQELAGMPPELEPAAGDLVFDKTGYSGFTSGKLEALLKELRVGLMFMTGLTTSQCVNTTARDASDRGFSVAFVTDALADYSEQAHLAALYSSANVCGGHQVTSALLGAEPDATVDAIMVREGGL